MSWRVLDHPFTEVKQWFYEDYTVNVLKSLIIAWCLLVIVVTIFVDNKWVLAGILAYELLP